MTELDQPPVITAGLLHAETLVVAPLHTVPEIDDTWPGFRDMPPVFATAMMIAFIEETCVRALRPYLGPHQRTVGTSVNVSHVAATPVGMAVTAEIELVEISGRVLSFKATCRDEAGLIGEGTHQRTIIDYGRFMERLKEKSASIGR